VSAVSGSTSLGSCTFPHLSPPSLSIMRLFLKKKSREWIWVFSLSFEWRANPPCFLSLPLYIHTQHLDSIYNKHIPHQNHICLGCVCQPSRDYITCLVVLREHQHCTATSLLC
jgi:hypothetical protein